MIHLSYTTSVDTKIKKTLHYDVVIVGAGLAGLYTALNIDESVSCIILAKESVDISSSWLAQGGIAAAISNDDNPVFHLEDTAVAGAGLCDMDAVAVLVNEGPSDIETLVSLRVPFDLDEYGELQITREGGHNKNRVVHAGGDATGRETVKALSHIVSQRKNITFSDRTCLFDILTDDNGVNGVVVRRDDVEFIHILSANVVIATGGIGQVYKHSTNPSVATGDGLAAAMRAGAHLTNIEFIQFHPTGLKGDKRDGCVFLISEAVRGEGGLLVNSAGERFMVGEHELAELAPRDIVARGVMKELRRSGEDCVYIDITSKPEDFLKYRFPTIYNECMNQGINIARDRIPVYPVQHYMMGGIETDLVGRTGIPGLYACGEAANTGVHGANRLASNSMLECLVFGHRAAMNINTNACSPSRSHNTKVNTIPSSCLRNAHTQYDYIAPASNTSCASLASIRETIQETMDEYCGVVRKKSGIEYALKQMSEILRQLETLNNESCDYIETLNIAMVAKAILEAALLRPESIGSHCMEE